MIKNEDNDEMVQDAEVEEIEIENDQDIDAPIVSKDAKSPEIVKYMIDMY